MGWPSKPDGTQDSYKRSFGWKFPPKWNESRMTPRRHLDWVGSFSRFSQNTLDGHLVNDSNHRLGGRDNGHIIGIVHGCWSFEAIEAIIRLLLSSSMTEGECYTLLLQPQGLKIAISVTLLKSNKKCVYSREQLGYAIAQDNVINFSKCVAIRDVLVISAGYKSFEVSAVNISS